MENWIRANFAFLDERVLRVMEFEVFQAQVDPSYDVENKNQVHQHVALLRSISGIRQKIDRIIQAGVNARAELRGFADSTLKEGEDDTTNR